MLRPARDELRVRRRAPFWLVFAVLAVCVSSFALVQSTAVPTLALLQVELGSTQSVASWVITAQLLSAAVATPIVGRLGDAFGKNRVLVFAVGALAVGSLIAAAAPTMGVLIGARVVQGIGGGVIPLAFGIARDEFPPHRRAGAIGVISSLIAAGFGVGIVVAGPLVDLVGIHGLFLLPAGVAVLAAVAAALVIPPSPTRSVGGVSVLPALLLAAWLTGMLLAVSQAPQWGWTSPAVLGLVSASLLVCAGWVLAERRAVSPVIDLAMMRQRAVWSANLVAVLVGFSMYASFGYVPQLVQTPASTGWGLGADVTSAGHVMLPGAAATFVAGLVAARLAARFGAKVMVVASCLVSTGGLVGIAMWHDTLWQVALTTSFVSLGIGLVFALLASLMVDAVPPHQTGVATGTNANLRTVGGAIGSAVTTSIVTASAVAAYPTERGYVVAFALLAVVMVVAAAAGLLVPGRRAATA